MAASAAAASRGALMRAGLTRRPVRRCSAAASPVPREAVKDILNHLIAGEDAAALKVAGLVASQEGRGSAEYAAHHASECAAVMFAHAEEARRQALISAGTGKALEGRDLAAVELLDSSLWLPEVQQCWSPSGGVAAAPAPEARDWQVLGRVVPVRLLLSPWAAVLQSYASSAVLESRSTAGIHPAVHGAMMNQAKHWQDGAPRPARPGGPAGRPERRVRGRRVPGVGHAECGGRGEGARAAHLALLRRGGAAHAGGRPGPPFLVGSGRAGRCRPRFGRGRRGVRGASVPG
ncbi:unnamed protein product, partial [Prorocentrum cordatum]